MSNSPTNDERLVELLGDAIDELEAVEALCPGTDRVLATLRFLRDMQAKRLQAAGYYEAEENQQGEGI